MADTAASVAHGAGVRDQRRRYGGLGERFGRALTIWSRTMGTAGNGMSVSADTGGSVNLTAAASGALAGGVDGDLSTMAWAQGWRTDLTAAPLINRAARDWHASYFMALRGYGLEVAAAFSMELQDGDPQPAAGIAQRYPDGTPRRCLLRRRCRRISRRRARRSGRSRISKWRPHERGWYWFRICNSARSSGGTVRIASGMPFYDAYTQSAFQTALGRPMGIIPSQNASPADFPDECAFLPTLIGEFTSAIVAFVRASYPNARFESLYPTDTNDTPLNKLINYPTAYWTPAALACLKTENFTFTGRPRFERSAQLDRVTRRAWVPAGAEQPPGGNQRLHDALAEREGLGAAERCGVGGAVRARPILSDRVRGAFAAERATFGEDGVSPVGRRR